MSIVRALGFHFWLLVVFLNVFRMDQSGLFTFSGVLVHAGFAFGGVVGEVGFFLGHFVFELDLVGV